MVRKSDIPDNPDSDYSSYYSASYDYDAAHEQHLINWSIYGNMQYHPEDARPEPENQGELNRIVVESLRVTSSAPVNEQDYQKFIEETNGSDRETSRSKSKASWIQNTLPYTTGEAGTSSRGQVLFDNLHPLAPGSLTVAQPDYSDVTAAEGTKEQIRADLGNYIVTSTLPGSPVTPNFFVIVEGGRGTPAVAQRRTCHISALGARAIHQLQSYGRDPTTTYGKNAYAITIQCVGSSLPIYAHHLTPSSNSTKPIAYHMTCIGG